MIQIYYLAKTHFLLHGNIYKTACTHLISFVLPLNGNMEKTFMPKNGTLKNSDTKNKSIYRHVWFKSSFYFPFYID